MKYSGLSEEIENRFVDLLGILKENDTNNTVALWTRYQWNQIERIVKKEPYMPSTLELDLSTACNDSCYFCAWSQLYKEEKKASYIPFTILKRTLEDFSQIPETRLIIFAGGGEPLTYPQFKEACYLASKNFDLYISTNGGLIGTKDLPIDLFLETPLILKFSINGATHKTYNYIHHNKNKMAVNKGGVSSLDYILKQIRIISKNRSKNLFLNTMVSVPRLIIAFTITHDNYQEIGEIAKLAVDVGVDELKLRPVLTKNKPTKEDLIGIENMRKVKITHSKYLDVSTFAHYLDYNINRGDSFEECVSHPIVNPYDNSVTPCLFRRGYGNEWLVTGDFTQKPILDIVQSENYRRVVKEKNKNLNSEKPKRCPRCRKSLNNLYLDILKKATPQERESIRNQILSNFPRTPASELLKNYN